MSKNVVSHNRVAGINSYIERIQSLVLIDLEIKQVM